MRTRMLIVLGMLLTALSVTAQPTTEPGVLLEAYTHFILAQQVQAQAIQLASPLSETDASQVIEEADQWMNQEIQQLRDGLDEHFGASARERFAAFVSEYTTAEKDNDLHYLGRLSGEALLGETPMEYSAMRSLVLEKWLQTPFEEGSRLLGEMQTWAEIRALSPKTPPLNAWLNREFAAAEQPTPLSAPTQPANPLMAAEAPAPEWTAPVTPPPANPMDAFTQSRSAERDRALMDAQAGMQQMAMERQAAETEYSAKKIAAAQADADAMRAQAQKMAAVEQEAIDQRANSWSGRLKKIVSATVGAATGAFTGGIGAEAGRQAAEAIFPR